MRISDWSSDVCSSDLLVDLGRTGPPHRARGHPRRGARRDVGAFGLGDELGVTQAHRDPLAGAFGVDHGGADGDRAGQRAPSDLVARDHERMLLEQAPLERSEEHTSELQSLMRISYAVFCLKKKK